MWEVIRTSPEGFKGYKEFNTKDEAEAWLNKDSVKEDESYGYSFSLINKGE